MLWLWMTTAWDLTFTRTPEGGSYQMGVIGTLGATAFSETMNTMSLEVPMLTIAEQLSLDFTSSGYDCHDFYYNKFGMNDNSANYLCTTSQNYTFTDPLQTAVALTTTYLYENTFNDFYYNEFISVSQYPAEQLNTLFYGDDSTWNAYYDSLQVTIKDHYKDYSVCTDEIITLDKCAFSNLTNSQWLERSLLLNPLPG